LTPLIFGDFFNGDVCYFLLKVIREEYRDELKKEKKRYKRENLERVVGFIFSRIGFTKEAEDYCRERGIACSEDEGWLETGK
jgi:hypothetical protein